MPVPVAFTIEGAKQHGLSKSAVYGLVDRGEVDRIGRGVYLRPGLIDSSLEPLAAATAVRSEATLCLTSALVWHDLSDEIPAISDIALPRGVRHPAGFDLVRWHSFDRATFGIGRTVLAAGGDCRLAVYSAERTIIDFFRLPHLESDAAAVSALRRWLGRKDRPTPAALLDLTASFPQARPRLARALEVLL